MSDPFVAEIRIVGFNFAPVGWATCDGQVLPISQNTALFSLLGTTYGGDGRTNFALPNLDGRAPMHPGQGPGLSVRSLGEIGGSPNVTLLTGQLPQHNHGTAIAVATALSTDPTNMLPAIATEDIYQARGTKTAAAMSPAAIGITGGNQPHNNVQPSLVLNFVIALQGVFPPRG